MHANQYLRDSLVRQAEAAFFTLSRQVDNIFNLTSFYIERYPEVTASDITKTEGISSCISEIGVLTYMLGDAVNAWKIGGRLLSKEGIELHILNEIWANIEALLYFFTSHDICLEVFDKEKATTAFIDLVECNRLLT
jgi:hypothetical protein